MVVLWVPIRARRSSAIVFLSAGFDLVTTLPSTHGTCFSSLAVSMQTSAKSFHRTDPPPQHRAGEEQKTLSKNMQIHYAGQQRDHRVKRCAITRST
eukprot:scaffold65624_cov39-Phaeocystis_antarctica.AAC.2